MNTAAPQQVEQKTPFELAHEAFDRQAAVVNAQMGFMHAQILPPRHIGTSLADIDNAYGLMVEAFGNLTAIAEDAGVELPEAAAQKFDMLAGSYALFSGTDSHPSDALIASLS